MVVAISLPSFYMSHNLRYVKLYFGILYNTLFVVFGCKGVISCNEVTVGN
jgi:hypothetical protein